MSTWKKTPKRGKLHGTRSCGICREPLTERERFRCNKCKDTLYQINLVHGANWTNLDLAKIGQQNREIREERVAQQAERIQRELAELEARKSKTP